MGTVLVGRDAMVAAGTLPPPHGPEMPVDVSALLDKLPGLDRHRVLAKLRELTDATKTVTASFMGKITDSIEVADNPTQLAATRLALEMHRLVGGENNGPRIGTVNILWAGPAPAWSRPSPSQAIDATVNGENNLIVTETERVPISTVEGTGAGGGPSTHTHSAVPGNGTVLTQRVKQKRKPRLPGWRKK